MVRELEKTTLLKGESKRLACSGTRLLYPRRLSLETPGYCIHQVDTQVRKVLMYNFHTE
jgi:hypothetical protein